MMNFPCVQSSSSDIHANIEINPANLQNTWAPARNSKLLHNTPTTLYAQYLHGCLNIFPGNRGDKLEIAIDDWGFFITEQLRSLAIIFAIQAIEY
ncbi:MAG: hypothetical protein RKH07_00970 [Gammaproteobacteria bacterium]